MTEEEMDEMIRWFRNETVQLTKDIHRFNDKQDYYQAARAEGMRDTYLRCINKLISLKLGNGIVK